MLLTSFKQNSRKCDDYWRVNIFIDLQLWPAGKNNMEVKILTPTYPQGYVTLQKCEQPLDTVKLGYSMSI